MNTDIKPQEFTRLAWAVLIICALMNAIGRGVVETFGVFVLPLQQEFDWSRAQVTLGYSFFMLSYGLSAPVTGALFDRLGPRAIYALGSIALGGGYFWVGYGMARLWEFYLLVGVVGGIGLSCLGMVSASALVSRWFKDRLASVMGVAYAAMGVGVLAIVPLAQLLVEVYGWRMAYMGMGGAVLGLIPVIWFILPMRRMQAGAVHVMESRRGGKAADGSAPDWTLKKAIRTSAFWGLFMVFFFTALCAYAVLPQAIAYFVEVGFDPIPAASAFGFTGVLSVFGMLGMSWLSEKIGMRPAATLSYAFSLTGIAAIILLATWPEYWLLYAFVLFFGSNQGARGPLVSTLSARLFPGGGLGAIYGAITMGLGFGGAIGSWGSGLLHDWTGDYLASFLFGGAGALFGLLQFWTIRALKDGRQGGDA